MYRNQAIQEANEIESVTDEAAQGGRYVFVNAKRRRARTSEEPNGDAPARELDDRPTVKMPRLARPEIATVKMPQLTRRPDPVPCECDMMYAALRDKIIDVSYLGPLYLVPVVASEAAFLRGSVSVESAEQAMRNMIELRHCPFDGTLMDPGVEVRPYAPVGGEEPVCCGMMADLVRAERIDIPAFKVGAIVLAKLLTPDGRRLPLAHCPFCGVGTIDTILVRYKRLLGL